MPYITDYQSFVPNTSNDDRVKSEEPVVLTGPLDIEISDNDLINLINQKTTSSRSYFESIRLKSRRERNHDFWLGNHYKPGVLFDYQVPYVDNLIYRNLETRCAYASSRIPEVCLTPPNQTQDSKDIAQKLETALNIRIKDNSKMKRMVKDALRTLHLDFIAIIKIRWDESQGKNGDFVFDLVKPDAVELDHTGFFPYEGMTADNMEFISEHIVEPLSLVIAKFPKKKEELLSALGKAGGRRDLASKIRYQEVWFTWYSDDGVKEEGVCWKYQNVILDKKKNPYYDWEGYDKVIKDFAKRMDEGTIQYDEMGMPINTEKVYNNFFQAPHKPYIFFTYQNLGDTPMDSTTPVEQAIPLQMIVDKRGRQITEIADNAVPKKAYAGKHISKDAASSFTNDPNEAMWFEEADDIRKAVMSIPANEPSPILYNDLVSNRSEIDAIFSTSSVTRGDRVPSESGISKQISREGNLSMYDDLIEYTVTRVIYEMAMWSIQMMKLFYDKEHFVRHLGSDGQYVEVALKQDKIEDGIVVNVKASTTDKAQERADSITLAQAQMTDPMTMFEMMDDEAPKEKTMRLIAYQSAMRGDPSAYLEVTGLKEANPEKDAQQIMQGDEIKPNKITPEYLNGLIGFVNSDQFSQQPPEAQQNMLKYVQSLRQQTGEVKDASQRQ